MAVLDLVKIPNSILNEPCDEVTIFDDSLKDLVDNMFETMHYHKGIGLAAPQIGILYRLCVCEVETEKIVLINPVLTAQINPIKSDEGCLSIPQMMYEVDRYEQVTVNAMNLNGESFRVSAKGLMAIVIQHEMDHLDGVLIMDKGQYIQE